MASSLLTSSTRFLPMSYITVNSGIEHGPLAIELAKTPRTRARVPQPARLYNVASAPRPCCIARVAVRSGAWDCLVRGCPIPPSLLLPPPRPHPSPLSSFLIVLLPPLCSLIPPAPPSSLLLPHTHMALWLLLGVVWYPPPPSSLLLPHTHLALWVLSGARA